MLQISAANHNFHSSDLTFADENSLQKMARKCRGDILRMTTLAGCGHPGGAMSSVDLLITLYACARVNSTQPADMERDRIIVSHGHTSAGVYSVLGNFGFFPIDEAIAHFRQAGSPYEGHVEHGLPGVEWSSGNLGQGLSAGCGMAVASLVHDLRNHVFVLMGDGEQQKGQISEARRFAVKYGLTHLTCVVDLNQLQISGSIRHVMPQNIRANFESDGWRVLEIDGHNFQEIYRAFHEAVHDRDHCVAIISRTVMGKDVSFMENVCKWHGQALPADLFAQAIAELEQVNDLDRYRQLRHLGTEHLTIRPRPPFQPDIATGGSFLYTPDKLTDNRSAWGKALAEITRQNLERESATPIAVFDCDLTGSVKTDGFAEINPRNFFQSGVMEHHTAVAAGALSTQDVLVFWADFGVFGVDEVYNQLRINDINETNLKLVCTHLGVDVGEDGKTHHCIDYLGLLHNLYHFKTIIPADPNQTDRAVRWLMRQPGNIFLGMGRSKCTVITKPDGSPFFDEHYTFHYGKADILREGADISVITMGAMAHHAVNVADTLAAEGIGAGVYNFSCAKQMDLDTLSRACQTGLVITYEDHNVHTGLGTMVADLLCRHGLAVKLHKMGIQDYVTSGEPKDLLTAVGLDEKTLNLTIRRMIEQYAKSVKETSDLEKTVKLAKNI
ncbi:MAG: transketolase [Acidobacteria bacterium]|nr:transketolase [Acidobacteriota bacterium]